MQLTALKASSSFIAFYVNLNESILLHYEQTALIFPPLTVIDSIDHKTNPKELKTIFIDNNIIICKYNKI